MRSARATSYTYTSFDTGRRERGNRTLLALFAFCIAGWLGWRTGHLLDERVPDAPAERPEAASKPEGSAEAGPAASDDTPRFSLGSAQTLPGAGGRSIFDTQEWVSEDGMLSTERPPLDDDQVMIVKHFFRKSFGSQFELQSVMMRADLSRPASFIELGLAGNDNGTHYLRFSDKSVDLIYDVKGEERLALHAVQIPGGVSGRSLEIVAREQGVQILADGREIASLGEGDLRRGRISLAMNARSIDVSQLVINSRIMGLEAKDICK